MIDLTLRCFSRARWITVATNRGILNAEGNPNPGFMVDEIGLLGLPPQHDKDGNLLSVFERTHILSLIPGMKFTPITEEGVPPGYEGPNGVRLFDPAVVKNRASVIL